MTETLILDYKLARISVTAETLPPRGEEAPSEEPEGVKRYCLGTSFRSEMVPVQTMVTVILSEFESPFLSSEGLRVDSG